MATKIKGRSAKVLIYLLVGERKVPVAQIGNSGLLVRALDTPIAAGEATLVIRIDDSRKVYQIFLPEGIAEPNRFVKFF